MEAPKPSDICDSPATAADRPATAGEALLAGELPASMRAGTPGSSLVPGGAAGYAANQRCAGELRDRVADDAGGQSVALTGVQVLQAFAGDAAAREAIALCLAPVADALSPLLKARVAAMQPAGLPDGENRPPPGTKAAKKLATAEANSRHALHARCEPAMLVRHMRAGLLSYRPTAPSTFLPALGADLLKRLRVGPDVGQDLDITEPAFVGLWETALAASKLPSVTSLTPSQRAVFELFRGDMDLRFRAALLSPSIVVAARLSGSPEFQRGVGGYNSKKLGTRLLLSAVALARGLKDAPGFEMDRMVHAMIGALAHYDPRTGDLEGLIRDAVWQASRAVPGCGVTEADYIACWDNRESCLSPPTPKHVTLQGWIDEIIAPHAGHMATITAALATFRTGRVEFPEDLLQAAYSGDFEAQSILAIQVSRYQMRIAAYFANVSKDVRKDKYSRVQSKVIAALEKLRNPQGFAALVRRATYNASVDAWRATRDRREDPFEGSGPDDDGGDSNDLSKRLADPRVDVVEYVRQALDADELKRKVQAQQPRVRLAVLGALRTLSEDREDTTRQAGAVTYEWLCITNVQWELALRHGISQPTVTRRLDEGLDAIRETLRSHPAFHAIVEIIKDQELANAIRNWLTGADMKTAFAGVFVANTPPPARAATDPSDKVPSPAAAVHCADGSKKAKQFMRDLIQLSAGWAEL